jgi:DNA topoisomerase II
MSVIGEPKITSDLKYDGIDFTCVSFEPDLKKFKMSCLDDDTVAFLSKRVYDLAGCTSSDVKVFLNGKKISSVTNFESYVDLYFKGTKKD